VLVDALARLHALGEPIGLVIAGRDGWGWTNPLDDPRWASLRQHVRVLRNVPDDDLRGLYAGAEALAYPSLHEGFGLPVAEAMACGIPVVTSRTSSLPEVAGGAALLVDPRDPQEIASCFLDLLRDPALRSRLIAAGLARTRELSWRRTAERTLEVYERVVRGD
jgi:alpha-1,3-rhamnosyl/mannosyltransferase